jgi:hypothetical protein
MWNNWRRDIWIAIVAVLLVPGCTSSFSARRVGSDGKLAAGDGIPYTLTKPEFRITRTVAEGSPTYRLNVVHVPDPEQRYTLKASPSIFADTDFTMNLNEAGSLDEVGLTVTDRIVPTITALGAVAVATLSLAALDDTSLAEKLDQALKQPGFRCPGDASGKDLSGLIAYVEDLDRRTRQTAANERSITADQLFQQSFHARTAAERTCLEAISEPTELKEALTPVLNLPFAQWRATHVSYLQQQIEAATYRAILAGKASGQDPTVQGYQDELGRTIGEEAAQRRLRQIEAQLDSFPPRPSGDNSAFAEYARMREQASQLRAQIRAAIGAALAAVAPRAPQPFENKAVPIVPAECVASEPPSELKCPGGELVVVLERVGGSTP